MNRDLVRVLKQTRASPRFTINEQPRRGTRHMLLLHRVRTFARTEFPQSRSDFSTNRSTRSHRVETFNRTLPQSREGGQESRRKHPPPPPLPLFLLTKNNQKSSPRKSSLLLISFFLRPIVVSPNLVVPKGRKKWTKKCRYAKCSPRSKGKKEEEKLWIESGSIKKFPRRGGEFVVFFFFF